MPVAGGGDGSRGAAARFGGSIVATLRERPIPSTTIDDLFATPGKPPRAFPIELVRSIIQNEWVSRLEDLLNNRRLMLHFSPDVSRETLSTLAGELVRQGKLAVGDVAAATDRCGSERLKWHFGVHVR